MPRRSGVISSISFTLPCRAKLIHSTIPPFPVKPAALGFDRRAGERGRTWQKPTPPNRGTPGTLSRTRYMEAKPIPAGLCKTTSTCWIFSYLRRGRSCKHRTHRRMTRRKTCRSGGSNGDPMRPAAWGKDEQRNGAQARPMAGRSGREFARTP